MKAAPLQPHFKNICVFSFVTALVEIILLVFAPLPSWLCKAHVLFVKLLAFHKTEPLLFIAAAITASKRGSCFIFHIVRLWTNQGALDHDKTAIFYS